MGLVESFFNTMATLHEGRTDIFYRIPLTCPTQSYDQLARRLPLVWALLCRRHPLLCAYVETLTPDWSYVDPDEAARKRHAGEASGDGGASSEPHFLFKPPKKAAWFLQSAAEKVVWIRDKWPGGPSRNDAVLAWLDKYVWNGPRRFLAQDRPFALARLIVLFPSPSSKGDDARQFDLVLCAAHCISDGLSISSLAGELLQLLTSPLLPTELPELEHRPTTSGDVPGARMATYATITSEMKHAIRSGLFDGIHSKPTMDVDDTLFEDNFASLLPPTIEASYPDLLPQASSSASQSKLARVRWFWTIRRVVLQFRAAKAEAKVLSDFKANRTDGAVKEPWWGAQTHWSVVRLSAEHTSALTQLAKRKGVRVGSLLYAVAACAINTMENKHVPSGSRSVLPTTTVLGFPFSVRRYLDTPPNADLLDPSGTDPLQAPSDLGVKLGFNGISLPPASLFSLTSPPSELTPFQVAQLWQTARQVQKQFNHIFAEPRFMHADGFLTGLERETRFRKNGVKDVFEVFKDDKEEVAGEDERKAGLTKRNMQGPGSSLNFSMVGLLDRVLPSQLDLADRVQGGKLEVGDDLLFGVRTRAGEAFGTSYTFKGQLSLEMGHDRVVWDTSKIEEYLELMKHIIEGMLAFERGQRS